MKLTGSPPAGLLAWVWASLRHRHLTLRVILADRPVGPEGVDYQFVFLIAGAVGDTFSCQRSEPGRMLALATRALVILALPG
jgi:hypothetical protein